jgi:ferredoxin-NADP reductase
MSKLELNINKTQRELNELQILVNAWNMCEYSNALHKHMEIGDQVALHKIINTLEERLKDIQEKVDAI